MFGKRLTAALIATLLASSLTMASVWACTMFCLASANRVIFGRNYDFDVGDGLAIVNPRGVQKKGYLLWTSDARASRGCST